MERLLGPQIVDNESLSVMSTLFVPPPITNHIHYPAITFVCRHSGKCVVFFRMAGRQVRRASTRRACTLLILMAEPSRGEPDFLCVFLFAVGWLAGWHTTRPPLPRSIFFRTPHFTIFTVLYLWKTHAHAHTVTHNGHAD